jgi:replicative DNA helicase
MSPNNGHGQLVQDDELHSVEAEEAVLGGILINNAALVDVQGVLRPNDFFIVRHQWIYEAMQRIQKRGEQIDYLTVTEELRAQAQLEELGGSAYLTLLINRTPPTLYIEAYGQLVSRLATRRRIVGAASTLVKVARDGTLDIREVVERAESALLTATQDKRGVTVESVSSILERVMGNIERAADGQRVGVPTGYKDIDLLLNGYQPGTLNIAAGRPGMGKTSWLLSIGMYIAKALNLPVLLISLEMTKEQMVTRLVSIESGIPVQRLKSGNMMPAEDARYQEACIRIDGLPFFIEDTPGATPSDVMALARRIQNEHGLALLLVDYLQLMEVPNQERDNREQQVSKMSRGLLATAKTLNIPVLAAAQLSRDCEKRQDKRPVLSDLRDSGSIEQDAYTVSFLYRDEIYNPNTEQPNQCEIIVAKHRDGATGTVNMYFRKELMTFAGLKANPIDLRKY